MATMQNKVAEILDRVGARHEIAAECAVEPIAVYRWSKSGTIPSKHLPGVLRVSYRNNAGITADALCAAHDQKSPSCAPKLASVPDGLPPQKGLDAEPDLQGAGSQKVEKASQ